MAKQIIIYGLGSAEKQYAVLMYEVLKEQYISQENIRHVTDRMKLYPEIKRIFFLDNTPRLSRLYKECIRENSIESHIIFKDLLERYATEIVM